MVNVCAIDALNGVRRRLRFMFQLREEEAGNLRYQNGTSSWGGRRYLPFAFIEQGDAMLPFD